MSPQGQVAVVQLLMFHMSPDSSLPGCVCSLCRRPFMSLGPEVEELEDLVDDIPIRMWVKRKDGHDAEIRFHVGCAEEVCVTGSKLSALQFRKDLSIAWAWGDDDRGRLLLTAPVSP